MTIKHAYRRSEEVNTRFGVLKLNSHGFVTNLDEIDAEKEELLNLPNFFDGGVFKEEAPKEPSFAEEKNQKESEEVTSETSDEDYKALIRELREQPDFKANSDGMVEMTYLNEKLREAGLPIISGTKRRKLVEEMKKEDESKEA